MPPVSCYRGSGLAVVARIREEFPAVYFSVGYPSMIPA